MGPGGQTQGAILKYLKPENSSFWTVLYQASTPKKQRKVGTLSVGKEISLF